MLILFYKNGGHDGNSDDEETIRESIKTSSYPAPLDSKQESDDDETISDQVIMSVDDLSVCYFKALYDL